MNPLGAYETGILPLSFLLGKWSEKKREMLDKQNFNSSFESKSSPFQWCRWMYSHCSSQFLHQRKQDKRNEGSHELLMKALSSVLSFPVSFLFRVHLISFEISISVHHNLLSFFVPLLPPSSLFLCLPHRTNLHDLVLSSHVSFHPSSSKVLCPYVPFGDFVLLLCSSCSWITMFCTSSCDGDQRRKRRKRRKGNNMSQFLSFMSLSFPSFFMFLDMKCMSLRFHRTCIILPSLILERTVRSSYSCLHFSISETKSVSSHVWWTYPTRRCIRVIAFRSKTRILLLSCVSYVTHYVSFQFWFRWKCIKCLLLWKIEVQDTECSSLTCFLFLFEVLCPRTSLPEAKKVLIWSTILKRTLNRWASRMKELMEGRVSFDLVTIYLDAHLFLYLFSSSVLERHSSLSFSPFLSLEK